MKKVNNELTIEKHPKWYYDIPVMNSLILGSYPPHKIRRNYEFYYPNKQNYFWRILAALDNDHVLTHFDGDEAVNERKQIMKHLKIGVQNMGKTISRVGTSARDTNIKILEYHNILSIIKKHPELTLIILCGFSAKNSTYYSFCNYLKSHHIKFSAPAKPSHGATFSITIDNRIINCVICTSTSTATKIPLNAMIIKFRDILKTFAKTKL